MSEVVRKAIERRSPPPERLGVSVCPVALDINKWSGTNGFVELAQPLGGTLTPSCLSRILASDITTLGLGFVNLSPEGMLLVGCFDVDDYQQT